MTISAIAAFVLALLAAACGSTVPTSDAGRGVAEELGEQSELSGRDVGDGPSPSSGASSAGGVRPTQTTARRTGGSTSPSATRTTGPIKVGFLYAVNDGAEQAGVSNGNAFTLAQLVRAFVESYNASGGLGGRRIEPVYGELHSASSDYEGQAASVCASFTQDNRVAAVLSNLGYYSENLLTCLASKSVPIISGDWAAPDREDGRRFPLFMTPTTLLGERRVAAMVTQLKAAGFLQPSSRIGVVIEDCPINQRIYRNALAPSLQRAGLGVATTFAPRCFQSIQDYAGQASDVQGAVLQFNAARVDRVIFVSQAAEANLMNLFSQGADAQQYFPAYALSSVAAVRALELNAPRAQLANAKGVGWLPALDTDNQSQTPPTATGRQCLDRMRKAGFVPASAADLAYVYGICDSFALYDDLLDATAGDARPASVAAAVDSVGVRYVSASTLEGRVVLRDGRIGAGTGRLFGWVSGHFEYIGSPFDL